MENITLSNKPGSRSLILLVFFIILAGLGGFVLGKYSNLGNQFLGKPFKNIADPSTPLYTNLQATIIGKVKRVDGRLLSIENNSGVEGSVEAAPGLYYTDTTSNPPKPPSDDLNSIPLNKNAYIHLEFIDGKLKAKTISISLEPSSTYTTPTSPTTTTTPAASPPPPALDNTSPPNATNSAKPTVKLPKP